MEPPSGDLGTTLGETAEVQIPDRPPIVEPTGGVIETGMVEVSEHPGDTTLKVVNEDAETIQAALTPHQVGA